MKSRKVCERSFEFAVRIVKLCKRLEELSGVARVIGSQLLRSGTSIGANVEEGQAAQSKSDFVHKHNVALKEARETCYWLRLLEATGTVKTSRIGRLKDEAEQIAAMLGAIVSTSKGKRRQ